MTSAPPDAAAGAGHAAMANAIRFLAADAVEKAKSGHPGMPMGMADAATVLFARFLKFDAGAPDWADRDRFVLSAGHGSMLLYALLYLTGYEDVTLAEIKRFRQLGSKTAGHPEYGHAAGIETTTGPLGQGLANAVGMAIAERSLNARFGDDLVDHFTYVVAGDGCLMEGISHEAISLAGHLGLGKLIVLFDDNRVSIDGPTALSVSDDQGRRFAASGWDTWAVDGHDPGAVGAAIEAARASPRPSLIACRTVIGLGAPTKAGTAAAHGAPLGADEIAAAREALEWPHPPFEVPAGVLAAWRAVGARGTDAREAWKKRLAATEPGSQDAFVRGQASALPEGWDRALAAHIGHMAADQPKWATRQCSGAALEVLAAAIPELVGGSADLTGSNNTRVAATEPLEAGDFSGRYLFYGVREHAMAAAMSGIALHKGLIPYGGTFLAFADYMRPAIRLAALMGLRAVYVLTHDSIGLGEDGPTHQPVETLASLRAIPKLAVFRPADAIETAECWALALLNMAGPSAMVLSRQAVPAVRATAGENLCARGGYVLAEAAGGARDVSLLATGTEVSVAVAAREILAKDGIHAAVVSIPCWELFDAQDPDYRASVLGLGCARVAVEAAISFGWERYVGDGGAFVGMSGFGASAPGGDLYAHFGITAEAVAAAAKTLL
jgi:transketolase